MIDRSPAMALALEKAKEAISVGEVPIGAAVVSKTGEIIGLAHNRVILDRDPTAHAEILAIRQAANAIGSERLVDCDLYVTLEPCAMCAQAISFARIRRLYFGAEDPKGGGTVHGARVFEHKTCHHRPDVYSHIASDEAAKLLRDFFSNKR